MAAVASRPRSSQRRRCRPRPAASRSTQVLELSVPRQPRRLADGLSHRVDVQRARRAQHLRRRGPGIPGAAPHVLPARRRPGADQPVALRRTAGRSSTSAAAITARTGTPRATCSRTRRAAPCSRACRSGRSRRAARATPKLLGEGDTPAIAPTGDRVAFVKDRRIWIAPLDGSKPAEQAFFARGTSESPAWSPDGRSLAFVSDRDDHSFIGIFTDASQPIRYLAASTSRDDGPLWSGGRRQIAFVRQPGRGGTPQSPLVQQPQPWSIMIADARAQPDGDPARSVVEERHRARRFDAAHRRRRQPALGRRRSPRLPLVSGRLAASLFDPASGQGRHADAADAGRVHGRARVADARRPLPRLQREHRRAIATTSIAATSSRCRSTARRRRRR